MVLKFHMGLCHNELRSKLVSTGFIIRHTCLSSRLVLTRCCRHSYQLLRGEYLTVERWDYENILWFLKRHTQCLFYTLSHYYHRYYHYIPVTLVNTPKNAITPDGMALLSQQCAGFIRKVFLMRQERFKIFKS